MSFLQQLQQKRTTLQATKTIVTTATGERYLEGRLHNEANSKLESRTYGFVVDTKPDVVAACILENFLYLGSQDSVCAANIDALGITHLLSVGIEAPHIGNDCMSQTLQRQFIPCLDLPETQLFVTDGIAAQAAQFIGQARQCGGRVLVHCNAGVSRSASVVLAYLLQHEQLDFQEAFALVKAKRPCAQPNAGFLQQLKSYKP